MIVSCATSRAISLEKQRAKIGKRVSAIVDEVTPKGAIGRTRHDAPEIDGTIILSSRKPLAVGDIVTAEVKRADAYDLHGTVASFALCSGLTRSQRESRRIRAFDIFVLRGLGPRIHAFFRDSA